MKTLTRKKILGVYKSVYHREIGEIFCDLVDEFIQINLLTKEQISNLEELLMSTDSSNQNMALGMIGMPEDCQDTVINLIEALLSNIFFESELKKIKSALVGFSFEILETWSISRDQCIIQVDFKDKKLKTLTSVHWCKIPNNSQMDYIILKKGDCFLAYTAQSYVDFDELTSDVGYLLENNFFDSIELSQYKQKEREFLNRF